MVQIERADELSPDFFNGCTVAGLTAGASTPAGIIKEVYATMSEEIKAAEGKEESFEELLNQSFKTLNNGDRVTGIVTAITPHRSAGGRGRQAGGLHQAQRAERRPQCQGGGHHPRGRPDRDLCGPRQRRGGLRRAVQEASGRCQGLGRTSSRPWRRRPFWRALSPRRTRAASWCPSRVCGYSSPPLRAVSPAAPICLPW